MLYTITLGFTPSRILKESLRNFYATRCLQFEHIFLDNHYPINKEQNQLECMELCEEYGLTYIDAGKNLGLHHGFNYALKEIGFKKDDIVIAFDADSYPTIPMWDLALWDTLQDPEIAWSSLMNPRSMGDLKSKGYETRTIENREIWIAHNAVVNSVCAFRGDFLTSTEGLHEPNDWYGHLETDMFGRLQTLGLRWGFVNGYGESDHLRDMHDRDYVVYKWCLAHHRSWSGDFESWLEAGKPNPDDNCPTQLP